MPREFETEEEIVTWADSLDERWPEREQVRAHMLDTLIDLSCTQPTFVELCSGDGRFARRVIDALPDARYVAIDGSASLCRYVDTHPGVDGVQADLRGVDRLTILEQTVDAIVTLQSLHDVGDGEAISRLYSESLNTLAEDGILLAADFVVPEDGFDPDRPGRLPISWHLETLKSAGYRDVVCSVEVGALACFKGLR
ncbi:MAG: hypothetical protein CME19_16060 [Gemmatimonadetes bacterium]|nr:hypothetical protein [Gemmatimonadota bacterium]